MPSAPPALIGSSQVCERLKIDKATLSRWVNSSPPKLRPVQRVSDKPNAAMLFDPADVDALLERRAA